LFIHTHVREDALELYGFLTEASMILFEQLIGVSGVGPKLALTLLSGMDAAQLSRVLISGDFIALTRVPGIGQKTAQRLVLELKDRLEKKAVIDNFTSGHGNLLLADLRSAILNLGYKSAIVEKAVKSVESLANDGITLELLVKAALKQLNS
ncbi:MAG: Holliday junction branch migration protein RuvA, partial [bacterium]|nr:Holliday junction branch migration protein RuvA [bacterium]